MSRSTKRWAHCGGAALAISVAGCHARDPVILPHDSRDWARIEQAVAPRAPEARGRDPWVFRCIFEDRTRMVVLAPASGLWIAFNPFTCGVYKAWRGEMLFRGKVWDFSQDNCAAKGETLLAAPSELIGLPDPPGITGGWHASGVQTPGFAFHGDGAALTSPAFDSTGWSRLFVAFDELSRRAPIRVEVSVDDGRTWDAQWFSSCTHVDSDDAWQWNFKELLPRSEYTRLRFVQERGEHRKSVRAVRVFGDRPAWSAACPGGELPVRPEFMGYRFIKPAPAAHPGAEALELMYDLRIGRDGRGDHSDAVTARVRHRIDARPQGAGATILESIEVEGLPEGVSVTLIMPAGPRVVRRCTGPGGQGGQGGQAMTDPIMFEGGAATRVEIQTEAQP